jgi:hypothetical protein
MNIYVQYNQSIILCRISARKKIGDLYQHILNTLYLLPVNIVYMVHDGEILGSNNLSFDNYINNSNIHNKSLIFVIINHYPLLSGRLTNLFHMHYQTWLSRRLININRSMLTYDPVFTNDNDEFSNIEVIIYSGDENTNTNTNVLTDSQFSQLCVKKFIDIKNMENELIWDICPITHENFSDDSDIVILQCGHFFSYNAIKTWLTQNNAICPYCKYVIVTT